MSMTPLATRQTCGAGAVALLIVALAPSTEALAQRSHASATLRQRTQTAEREGQALESVEPGRSAKPSRAENLSGDERRRMLAALREEIEEIEAQDGPNARKLIAPLTALGSLYQEGGEHALAIAATNRALEVVRYNDGLYTLEQAPLIRQLVDNAEVLGSAEMAWELEQKLLALAERHPTDLHTARILRDTADRRMDVLSRYKAGEFPPEIVLGCYYAALLPPGLVEKPNCTAGSSSVVKYRLLYEAQTYYAQAANIILQNEQYASDELPSLLMDLVQSSYIYNNPTLGERSLRYLLAYQTTNSEPWLERIGTLVRIADWNLLYSDSRGSNGDALAIYAQAYELLREHGIAQASIDQIFSPATPVVIPEFRPNPLSFVAASGAAGYIDIAFEVDKYGRAQRIEILDTVGRAARSDHKRLKELVIRSRFRPMTTDGQFTDSGRIVVRYYVNG